ncbi:CMGC/MAPK protein kinase [Coniosporium apollinis CBS 100218]|uniref:CMGC/MAPK protein kinase n=1 Tax=Coniosporium apollinis (strain CBS 100218) TaxID=1168221 RepID=R7Z7S2_CONA1|nr:CMGC/MAPK protein kinase [Coniosporium apollinis CBS 100218]EON70074.1 CMGC/MAPK protein kinase [Coniosporium apollinis CBS 100218]
MVTPLREGQELLGESGDSYLTVSPLGNPQPGTTSNVWTAVDAETNGNVFILKQPAANDYFGRSWPKFQTEMVMHELFKDCRYIRRQIDRIPPPRNSPDPPRLVLEPTECTLTDARELRPLTDGEIKTIMKHVLLGLKEIHSKGLVYADLKMDNIFVNGMRETARETTDQHSLIAMIGDLGIVMEPAHGKVQPLAYRSPEVHFKSIITPAADIWSWGIIYVHLLQAQAKFGQRGIYENVSGMPAVDAEQKIRRDMADDFELDSVEFYRDCVLPTGHSHSDDEIWSARLLNMGAPENAVRFLAWVLNPDPEKRPTAAEILQQPWFGGSGKAFNFTAALRRPIIRPTVSTLGRTTSGMPTTGYTPRISDDYMRRIALDRSASSYAPSPAATPQSVHESRPSMQTSSSSYFGRPTFSTSSSTMSIPSKEEMEAGRPESMKPAWSYKRAHSAYDQYAPEHMRPAPAEHVASHTEPYVAGGTKPAESARPAPQQRPSQLWNTRLLDILQDNK